MPSHATSVRHDRAIDSTPLVERKRGYRGAFGLLGEELHEQAGGGAEDSGAAGAA